MKQAFLKWLFLFLLFPLQMAMAFEPAIIDQSARFHPQLSTRGMVVSQEVLASAVGADILKQGGNAVDAAVATGFALAVTLPQAGNLGGGGFMLVHLAKENRSLAIDYREMAPTLAYRDMFLDEQGSTDANLSRFSHKAAGVPGTVAGLLHALDVYGTMTVEQVLAPAIRLAEEGFVVSGTLVFSLGQAAGRLRADRASAGYFFRPDGSPMQRGDIWRQADLAATLRQIANQGVAGFYTGKTAELIVAEMKRGGGLITAEDLANYRVLERQPVVGDYRGYRIVSMPPPSSGGVHLVQMLNVLEGWDLHSLGHNSAAYLHLLVETMRRAYADRSQYLGDPDFFDVPVEKLIDKSYAARLRDNIDLEAASASADVQPGQLMHEESPQTTHFTVVDRWGNVVSNTYTLNFSYGSGISVAGAGFLLNNEMDDFSAKPGVPNAYGLLGGEANAVHAGKRPLSSMTPTIVLKDGVPILATGSPGGSTIITVVLQNILNVIDFGMNVAEATAAPRIHHQWWPDMLQYEQGISIDTLKLLQNMGHSLNNTPRVLGKVQAISQKSGRQYGVTDSRWPGGGAVAAD